MNPANGALFAPGVWKNALESYARAAQMSVQLFDAEGRAVLGPLNPTPIHQLFAKKGYDPGLFAECARQCLAQAGERPAVLVSEFYGLTVIGTSLVLAGEVVGAAVGGYAFADFSQISEVERLARDAGIPFERLWSIAIEQKPVPRQRLALNADLLQVLGDALLRENHRTRQYEEAVAKLEETAQMRNEAYAELEHASEAARESEERLRRVEKIAAANQLASSMAHEINNPLASVTNALYLLESGNGLDVAARSYVGLAARELARVSRIVKQSLSYYSIGTLPVELDLGAIVNESIVLFKERFQRAHVEVKARVQSGTTLLGFAGELRQVVDNLLLNAVEAMPGGGGRVWVSVHESFDWARGREFRKGVRLTVADNGCGIPREFRERIMEPFFTTKLDKGTGLGLWVLRGILAKHEGSLRVRSSVTPGSSGTAISIFLPAHAQILRKPSASAQAVA